MEIGCEREEEWRAQQDSNLWPLAPEASESQSEGIDTQPLTGAANSGCPDGCPTIPKNEPADPKAALLEALRNVDRDTLLAVLAEVLTVKGSGA